MGIYPQFSLCQGRTNLMNEFDKDFWDMLDRLFDKYDIEIDRPKGSMHPKYSDYIYPLDYGFLKGTVSSAIISSVDFIKGDSEIKILYACTDDEIEMIYKDHNRSDGMKGILTRR